MYYVLFHYIKKTGKNWYCFLAESEVIHFLHESYGDIEVDQIIEAKAAYHLGLVVTEDYIKSELEPEKETESLVPIEVVDNAKAILREKKRKLKELETPDPSGMEKIADDIEKEMEEDLTPEEEDEKVLDDADALIEREKKRQEQKKKGWELCIECNSNRVAPWNKKKICSPCQTKKKTNRPYSRSKEFPGL